MNKGIEGHVDLAFDVATSGKVVNIRIVDSQPKNIFNRAAVTALKKWKYNPQMVDGVAQVQRNIQTRIRFNLET